MIADNMDIALIKTITAKRFGVLVSDLEAKTRVREIVIARQTAMVIIKELLDVSLKTIGYYFGKRDHSTVIHSITTVSDMMDTSKSYSKSFREVMEECRDCLNLPSGSEDTPVDNELRHLAVNEKQMVDYSKNSSPVKNTQIAHREIEDNPLWSVQNGFTVSRLAK